MKEELQEGNRLGMLSRKTTRVLKPALSTRNHTLNSDAALNYKQVFGPHRSLLPYLYNLKMKQI